MLAALDLARRIEAGELNPACCRRTLRRGDRGRRGQESAPSSSLDLDAARRAAEDPRLAGTPLRGLPVGFKDIFDTADLPTQYGSPIYAGYRPRADAAAVAMARRAGGLILGKTVTTEFAWMVPAGTRNPRNPAHTPGGSSSGSAAAVAAAMVPIALGSQTAGSVDPAGGVLRRRRVQAVVPADPDRRHEMLRPGFSIPRACSAPASPMSPSRRRQSPTAICASIAASRRRRASDFSARICGGRRARRCTARSKPPPAPRKRAGAKVTELTLPPILEEAYGAHGTIQDYEVFRALAFEYDRHRDELAAPLREQLDRAAAITADEYDAARRTATRARQAMPDLLREYDVILTPSAPGAAPHGLGSTGNPAFNRLWTLMGTPCVNVPGLREGELPLGMQIVGRFGRDRLTLEAALFLERAIAKHSRA